MSVSTGPVLSIMTALMMLAGCAEFADPTVGEGPITLSSRAEQAFADYQAKPKPRYFAVSEDGSAFFYSYCDVERCLRQVKSKVVDKCESYSNGVPCKIYGSHGQIVWVARPPR